MSSAASMLPFAAPLVLRDPSLNEQPAVSSPPVHPQSFVLPTSSDLTLATGSPRLPPFVAVLNPLITELSSPQASSPADPLSVSSTCSATSTHSHASIAGALDEATSEQLANVNNARRQQDVLRAAAMHQIAVPPMPSTTRAARRPELSHRRTASHAVRSALPPMLTSFGGLNGVNENGEVAESARLQSSGASTPGSLRPAVRSHGHGHARSASFAPNLSLPLIAMRSPVAGGSVSQMSSPNTLSVAVSPNAGAGNGPSSSSAWSVRLTRVTTPVGRDSSCVSGTGSDEGNGGGFAKRFGMSLSIPCGEFALDRAQSYVVREHTVVVGAYRINQSGLYSDALSPSPDDDDDDDMYSDLEEEDEEQDDDEENDLYDENALTVATPQQEKTLPQLPSMPAETMQFLHRAISAHEPNMYDPSHAKDVAAEAHDAVPEEGMDALEAAYLAKQQKRMSNGGEGNRGSNGSRRSSVTGLNRRRSSLNPLSGAPGMSLRKEDLVELEVIGRGQNGTVRKAVHLPTLTRVAVKSMDVYEHASRHQLLHELQAFSGLSSPYIIRLLGAYHDSGVIILASEYMDAGSLTHCMKRLGGRIGDESLLKSVAYQSLKGLEYLHSQYRLHRDIKPDNILLGANGGVKLGDFGLMTKLSVEQPFTSEFMGTLAYLSPERLSSSDYSFVSDIWSMGVSLIYAATGHLPIVGADFWQFMAAMEKQPPSLQSTIDDIRSGVNKGRSEDDEPRKSDTVGAMEDGGEEDDGGMGGMASPILKDEMAYAPPAALANETMDFSTDFHDFIAKMLIMDPEQRWSATQLLAHPFLAGMAAAEVSTATVGSASLAAPLISELGSHADVLRRNGTDLDVILNILAKRQLVKQANRQAKMSRRMHAQQAAAAAEAQDSVYTHITPPAFDVDLHQKEAQQKEFQQQQISAAIGLGAPAELSQESLTSPDAGKQAFGGSALQLPISPGVPANPPNTPARALSSMSVSSAMSVRSTASSLFSPMSNYSATPSVMSSSSFGSASTTHRDHSLFSPTFSPQDMSSATPFGSPAYSNSYASLTTSVSPEAVQWRQEHEDETVTSGIQLPASSASLGSGMGSFPLPPPPASFSAASGSASPSNMAFVLPAAPSMGHAQSPTSGSGMDNDQAPVLPPSSDSFAQHGHSDEMDEVQDSVEIMAVVSRLDNVRARALAQQFAMSTEDIQQRFSLVQLALFDEMEAAQVAAEQAAAEQEAEGQLWSGGNDGAAVQSMTSPGANIPASSLYEDSSDVDAAALKMKQMQMSAGGMGPLSPTRMAIDAELEVLKHVPVPGARVSSDTVQ